MSTSPLTRTAVHTGFYEMGSRELVYYYKTGSTRYCPVITRCMAAKTCKWPELGHRYHLTEGAVVVFLQRVAKWNCASQVPILCLTWGKVSKVQIHLKF